VSVAIKIPDLGAADDNVTLVHWLVEVGDEIARGQKLAAIETDKAVVELESVAAGVLLKKCAAEGDDATVGDVIAYIGKAGESVTEAHSGSPSDRKDAFNQSTAPVIIRACNSDTQPKARVSPLVRNFAKQQGVDLDKVAGTGPGGIITRQDVLAAANRSVE